MLDIKTLCAKNKNLSHKYIVDKDEEEKKKERNKPSIERKKTPNEKKYNEFVASLYRNKKKY